jgi:hypothetical protein
MENQFSEKESLELISQMINSAKNNLQKGTGKFFLLWGYLISGIALLNLILLLTLPDKISHYAYYAWFISLIGILPHFMIARKIMNDQIVKSYIESIMSKVWIAFGISIAILMASMMLASFHVMSESGMLGFLNWIHWSYLIPFMLILYGFALFVSGNAYQFRPLISGAFICWVSTLVIFTLYRTIYFMEFSLLALIISLVAGYIIPGHMLNNKEQKNV